MRKTLLALTTVAFALGSPALAATHKPVKKRPAPAKVVPAEMLTCKDGTIGPAKAGARACRGHGGIFAAVATKTVAAPPGGVSAATVSTKLPNTAGAKTTAVTENNGDSHAVTEVTQISTPGAPATGMKPSPTEITVRCYDGSVLKVRTLRKACARRGGLASSVVTTAMRVPAGATKSIAAKTAAGVAVATTKNPDNAASATRVSQTTIYPRPESKGKK